jgi:1,4-dihydroxy-2-naphthoate octaprenyltransferase
MSEGTEPRSRLQVWVMAIRPRTLPVSVAPVVVGSSIAAAEGVFRAAPALAALVGALLLQIASNLANDLFDHEKGADTEARIGPDRVMQLGLVSAGALRAAIAGVLVLATGVGLYLASVAGWPVVAIGLCSVLAALAYTGGPWPLGYNGLGDLAVFVFFGLVAVNGSYFVQSGGVSMAAFAASWPVGMLATAILVVNNVRDIETDRVAGKHTLAVRWGREAGRNEYALLVTGAYASLLVPWLALDRSAWVLLPVLTLPLAVRLIRTVQIETDGPILNRALAGTAQLCLAFSLALALGWLL